MYLWVPCSTLRGGTIGGTSQYPRFAGSFSAGYLCPPSKNFPLKSSLLVLLFLLLTCSCSWGQANFRRQYEAENPAPSNSGVALEERFRIHRNYLAEAEQEADTLKRILGELYLFYDNLYSNDYPAAAGRLLTAEKLAEEAGDPGWRGWVAYRRGTLHLRLRELESALTAYGEAVEACGAAGDSLCVAENLEQLGAIHSLRDSVTLAAYYFDRAMPLLRRHGSRKQLATAYANFGTFLNAQDRHAEAIPFLTEASDIQDELGNLVAGAKARNNLGLSYLRTGRHREALELFQRCLALNRENDFRENALRNYAGIRESFVAQGNYRAAYEYQEKFTDLRDSLIGEETKLKIADLEARFSSAEQELALATSQRALLASRRRSEHRGFLLLLLLLAAAAAGWRWWRQERRSRLRIEEGRENLRVLTRLLAEKNAAVLQLRTAARSVPTNTADPEESDPHFNPYDQVILTGTDWTDFKAYFEQRYPGYLRRLRTARPDLTEAEERLFLLLKLDLTTQEVSQILGISPGSVKKTRSRLRKRLGLERTVNLDDFVKKF